MLFCIFFTVAGFIVFPNLIARPVAGPVFAFTLGGVEGMIYAMGVILLGQRFSGVELASAMSYSPACGVLERCLAQLLLASAWICWA